MSSTTDDFLANLYHYRASCPDDDHLYGRRLRVYDGDTCRLDLSIGFSVVLHRRECRLWGINAPKLNNPETKAKGLLVRDYLRNLIVGRNDLLVTTLKDATDTLGSRYMVKIYIPQPDGSLLFVNDHLMEKFPEDVVSFMR